MREEHATTDEQRTPTSEAYDKKPDRGSAVFPEADGARGVYGISVAAELVGMGVQTLRLYEARGLLEPERTEGRTRRYSTEDLDRLRHIAQLQAAGVNLAGIGMVLDLEARLAATQQRLRATKNTTARPGGAGR